MIRRLWLIVFVLTTYSVCFPSVVYATENVTHLLNSPEIECPPGDGYTWRFNPNIRQATHAVWIQTSREHYLTDCNLPSNTRMGRACARVLSTGEGLIFSRDPFWIISEWIVIHEICHLKGWQHDEDSR